MTLEAFEIAKASGVITVLNPAPGSKISDDLLEITDIIVPNETESAITTGIPVNSEVAMNKTATYFKNKGVNIILITLGSKGVYYSTKSKHGLVSAYKVNAVDTTGAGDTFIGAMCSVLNPDLSNIYSGIMYGEQASSIAVQKLGAQPSIPTKAQVEEIYGKEK